jgi:cytidylate kinase
MVGRGSQFFLRDRKDTLRFFLYAPREDKVQRLLARGKTEEDAWEHVDTVDRERRDFIEKYFNAEWPNRSLYHAMLNTAIGDEAVVQTILSFRKTFDSKLAMV